MNLTDQKCIPCEVGGVPLTPEEATHYYKDIPDWKLADDFKKISRGYKFKDFKESMNFVNKVAELVDREGHHPDISISYNKVTLELTTHAMKGLSVNDFIVAAKIDKIN
ncbi:MAG: 4a-hydroxytetrahydrobiopterin dehydratase [Patescibacteria group bacterium]